MNPGRGKREVSVNVVLGKVGGTNARDTLCQEEAESLTGLIVYAQMR